MKNYMIFIFAFIGIIYASCSYANDTLVTVVNDGMAFKHSKEITMESEELYISLDTINVKYLFKNQSDKNIQDTVVFPFPTIDLMSPNLIEFWNSESKTFVENPFKFQLKINNATTAFLVNVDKNSEECDGIPCTVTYQYYWDQMFPAHQPVIVEHRYLTGYGSSYTENSGNDERSSYCVDEAFAKALINKKITLSNTYNNHMEKRYGDKKNFFESWLFSNSAKIDYILQTAKNWKGGKIGHFKMIIDKGSADNLLSLCWKAGNLKKISSTQFLFEADNFIPNQDLKILIVGDKLKDEK